VEPDIIGRSYEYLIRKFAEGSGQSAGEFYTLAEVGLVMARIMDIEPGMDVYDPCCGSAGLLIKCELVLNEKMASLPSPRGRGGRGEGKKYAPARLYGQENEPGTWAMANMNMIIHDMEGEIQIGDTFRKPKFRKGNRLQTFDRVVANPMWNQTEFKEKDYDADELDRFPKGAGFPGGKADWGWMQHILASLNDKGRAAVVLGTGAASRGSGNANNAIRKTKVGRENQILSADIQPSGRFPVIDQGQAFIAGYSDAEKRVIGDDLPLVIFGDHTRCVKYVDFPFILGADGTKVLKPREDLFDPKFFYYALLSLDIPNRGYNRHFSVLKEKSLPRPEKDEQRKIAAVLGIVQRAIEQQEQLLQRTAD